jgi:hypothetical protein
MKKLLMVMVMVFTANSALAAPKLKRIYLESNTSFELTKEGIETILDSQTEEAEVVKEVIRLSKEVTQEDLKWVMFEADTTSFQKSGCKEVCVETCFAGVCGSVCGSVCDD